VLQQAITEGEIERGVTHQQPEEQRAVEQIGHDLDVDIAA
jgi:hypothetical protein